MRKTLYPPRPKGIKKWTGNIRKELEARKQGVTIDGLELFEVPTGKPIYADYEIIPVVGEKGLYRVEEKIMSDKSYRRRSAANQLKNDIEKEKYLAENPIFLESTRRMYMTADYSVIKQLRDEVGIKTEGDAIHQFRALIEMERIKTRIQESGNKVARAIYREGETTDPRTLGYIGGLIKRDKIKRVYDLRDRRAAEVNQSIFEGILKGNKRLRDRYEDRQL